MAVDLNTLSRNLLEGGFGQVQIKIEPRCNETLNQTQYGGPEEEMLTEAESNGNYRGEVDNLVPIKVERNDETNINKCQPYRNEENVLPDSAQEDIRQKEWECHTKTEENSLFPQYLYDSSGQKIELDNISPNVTVDETNLQGSITEPGPAQASSSSLKGKGVTCEVCFETFLYPAYLKNRMIKHSGEKSFKCTECDKVFAYGSYLKKHMRLHTGDTRFKCTECDLVCFTADMLEKHMMIHSGSKPHKCTMCGKSYTWMCQLNTHMMVHTGEKPYKCTVCNMGFTQIRSLTRHMPVHSDEKRYKCTLCIKSYTQREYLEIHMKKHSGERPYKCSLCKETFVEEHTLKTHELLHMGEKPFKCVVCETRFIRNNTLIAHMQRHTGEKSVKLTPSEMEENVREMSDELITVNNTSKAVKSGTMDESEPTVQIEVDDDLVWSQDELLNCSSTLQPNWMHKTIDEADSDVDMQPLDISTSGNKPDEGESVGSEIHENADQNWMHKTIDEEDSDIDVKPPDSFVSGEIETGNKSEHRETHGCNEQSQQLDNGENVDKSVLSESGRDMNTDDTTDLNTGNTSDTKDPNIVDAILDRVIIEQEISKAIDHLDRKESGADESCSYGKDKNVLRSGKDRTMSRYNKDKNVSKHGKERHGKEKIVSASNKAICPECGKKYNHQKSLKRHLKSHNEEYKFMCGPCHSYFSTEAGMTAHRESFHKESYLCNDCGKSFERKFSLEVHMRRHRGQAKHICPYQECGKKFYNSVQYFEHINLHTGYKPEICHKCSKSFHSKRSLRSHIKLCVDNALAKCKECLKVFSSNGALRNHMDSAHKNQVYSCNCGKVYKYRTGLFNHWKHSGHPRNKLIDI